MNVGKLSALRKCQVIAAFVMWCIVLKKIVCKCTYVRCALRRHKRLKSQHAPQMRNGLRTAQVIGHDILRLMAVLHILGTLYVSHRALY